MLFFVKNSHLTPHTHGKKPRNQLILFSSADHKRGGSLLAPTNAKKCTLFSHNENAELRTLSLKLSGLSHSKHVSLGILWLQCLAVLEKCYFLKSWFSQQLIKCNDPGCAPWHQEAKPVKILEFSEKFQLWRKDSCHLGPGSRAFGSHEHVCNRHFQDFLFKSCPQHNVFFLSFSPSRGATSIVYRCKQKGTQKPYALKVLKKTVSSFCYIIVSLGDREARNQTQKLKWSWRSQLLSDGSHRRKSLGLKLGVICGEKDGKKGKPLEQGVKCFVCELCPWIYVHIYGVRLQASILIC